MTGMIQILTYLLSFYLVIKGIEILQIGLASSRENRTGLIVFGVMVLIACFAAAIGFTYLQDNQALSMQGSRP